jgi:hypothetical protein
VADFLKAFGRLAADALVSMRLSSFMSASYSASEISGASRT